MTDDLRAAAAAAFEAHEPDSGPDEAPAPEPAQAPEPAPEPVQADGAEAETEAAVALEKGLVKLPTETAPAQDGRARDEKGRFAPKGKEPPAAAGPPAQPSPRTGPAEKPPPEVHAAQPQGDTHKPPPGWTPAAREEWAKVPPTVQAEVWRREKENAQNIRQSAEARQFHEAFRQTVAPYEAAIRAEGVDALTAARNLFQATHVLQSGPPLAKAQLWVQVARTYGIAPELIEQVWTGQGPASGAGQAGMALDPGAIAAQVEQRVLAQVQQQRMASIQARESENVEKFGAQHEFFDDVRETMALLIDAATAQRKPLSLDDAYKMALGFHPDISQVLQQRDAAKAAQNAKASTERAKAAASSIRSQPATAPRMPNGAMTMEDAVAAAFDEVSSR
jgi:hypothetical protein